MKTKLDAALLLSLLLLPVALLFGCAAAKGLSGTWTEADTDAPWELTIKGGTLIWALDGDVDYEGSFSLRKEGKTGTYPGLTRVLTPDLPFPKDCELMLFYDGKSDRFLYVAWASDGSKSETWLLKK